MDPKTLKSGPYGCRKEGAAGVEELEQQQARAGVREAARGLAEFVARVFESGLSAGGSHKVRSSVMTR